MSCSNNINISRFGFQPLEGMNSSWTFFRPASNRGSSSSSLPVINAEMPHIYVVAKEPG